MSNQTAVSAAPRRSSRHIFLPVVLLGLAAIGWSCFWWYASTRVVAEWDRFVTRQAELGRQIHCDSRSVAGYPFRLEMRCDKPLVDVIRGDHAFSVNLADLSAVAQVYQPNKVLLAAKGPLTLIDKQGDGDTLTANWQSAEASMSLWTSGPQNADIVVKGLDSSANRGGQALVLVNGANVEAHVRVAEGANAAPGAYDLAATADARAIPLLDSLLGQQAPLSGSFLGTVTRIDLRPMPMNQRLRGWADNGGTLAVDSLQVNRGPSSVRATGSVGLDPAGHPTGELAVAFAGVGELADMLRNTGRVPASASSLLGVGLSMLGKPTNIDGKAAVEVPVKLRDGKASIGAFPVGKVPTLFRDTP